MFSLECVTSKIDLFYNMLKILSILTCVLYLAALVEELLVVTTLKVDKLEKVSRESSSKINLKI